MLPSSGISRLPTVFIGLDLKNYASPLVSAGFNLPFYLGFLSVGLIGASQIRKNLRQKRERTDRRGVPALFTPDE